MNDLSLIMRKANSLPDQFDLVDENGELIDGEDAQPVVLTPAMKFAIAAKMLRDKQSFETVVLRITTAHARKVMKEHGVSPADTEEA